MSSRLPDLDPGVRAELAHTVRRVVDKLLHTPTVRVKQLAEAPGGDAYAEALRELFGLDPQAPAAVTAVRAATDPATDPVTGPASEPAASPARVSRASVDRVDGIALDRIHPDGV
jgi:hypothetical protein